MINEGPAAGIYTTEERNIAYSQIHDDITANAPSDGYVYFAPLAPFCYLMTERPAGVPRLWSSTLSYNDIILYHTLYLERKPTFILILDKVHSPYRWFNSIEKDMHDYADANNMVIKDLVSGNVIIYDTNE